VAVAALPVVDADDPLVFWLPVALTPGKLMFAEPLKDTPPIVLAVCRVVAVVAVAALPPIFSAVAVPVTLVITPEAGVPRAGVTSVGLVAKTFAPDPVSLVSAAANCADVNDPRLVALPTEVTAPVRLALVVTVAAFPLVFWFHVGTPPVKPE
jgi:hypothetical protein